MPYRSPVHKPPFHKTRAQRERERKNAFDQTRPGNEERGYDARWRALRSKYLARNPMCCVYGCGRMATDVDHVETVKARPELRLTWSNLRSLCHAHHSRRTAIEQGFARRGTS